MTNKQYDALQDRLLERITQSGGRRMSKKHFARLLNTFHRRVLEHERRFGGTAWGDGTMVDMDALEESWRDVCRAKRRVRAAFDRMCDDRRDTVRDFDCCVRTLRDVVAQHGQ